MAITVNGRTIQIRGSSFVSHECEISRMPVLMAALHKLSLEVADPLVEIIFDDGEPIGAVNIVFWLDQIRHKFKLSKDQMIVSTNDQSFIYPHATIKHSGSGFLPRALRVLEPWGDIALDSDSRLFGALFARFSIDRFLLAAFMGTALRDHSIFTFHPEPDWIASEFRNLEEHFVEDLEWYRTWKNSFKDMHGNYAGSLTEYGDDNLSPYRNFWPKYKIEIIAETNTHSAYFMTEKTCRCLLTKKPFLLYGGAGSLDYLRKLGFKTFANVFDESYDLECDAFARLDMIKKEMLRISQLSYQEQQEIFTEIEPILAYNRDNYKNITRSYVLDFSH